MNGAIGLVWAPHGKPRVVFSFTIEHGKITAINLIAEAAHLDRLELAMLDE